MQNSYTTWSKEKIVQLYLLLSKKWKSYPTRAKLIRMGYSKLVAAVARYYKGFHSLFAAIGLKYPRNRRVFWTCKKLIEEIRKFCQTNRAILRKSSFSKVILMKKAHGLMNAAQRYGGLKWLNSRYKLGLNLRKKKWSKSRIIAETRILFEAGYKISFENLRCMGRQDLAGAIHRYSNIYEIKKAIGAPAKKYKIWTEIKIVKSIKPIIKKLGVMPTHSMLKAMGRGDLSYAMSKHGGSLKFVKMLNVVKRTLLPANDGHYLQSSYECIFDNILSKYGISHKVHVRISENYPYKCDFLIDETYIEIAGWARKGCNKYPQKMKRKIRLYNKLGKKFIKIDGTVFQQRIEWIEQYILELLRKNRVNFSASPSTDNISIKPRLYWADFNNVKKELRPLIILYGRMPTYKELAQSNRVGLAKAIYLFHSSLYDVAKRLKVPSRQVSREFYSRRKALCEYKELCQKHKKFLTMKELYHLKLRGLAHSIIKYGGFIKLRRKCKLDYSVLRVRKPLISRDKIIQEYKKICKEHHRFLTRKELYEFGFSKIAGYLNRNGFSLEEARLKTGLKYKLPYLPKGYYSQQFVINAYKQKSIEYGRFLTQRETREKLSSQMTDYINRNGGFRKLRSLTKISLK